MRSNIRKGSTFFFLNLLYEKGREEEVLNAGVKGTTVKTSLADTFKPEMGYPSGRYNALNMKSILLYAVS